MGVNIQNLRQLRYSERGYTEIVCDFWENAYISWFWSNIERTYSPIKDMHITSKNIHGICSIYDKDVYFSTPLPPEKKHLPNKQTHAHIVASTLTYTHTHTHTHTFDILAFRVFYHAGVIQEQYDCFFLKFCINLFIERVTVLRNNTVHQPSVCWRHRRKWYKVSHGGYS